MLVVAHEAERRSDLRQRARAALEYLRDETGESVLLAALDSNRVVTLDVVESSHLMRTVPRVGMVIPSSSAAGLAALAYLDPDDLRFFLGDAPSLELLATLDEVRSRGWSLNFGDIAENASAVAAAVLNRRGHPAAVLAISAPTERMPASSHERLGHLVSDAATRLSG
jgi:IclR family acetate operon transcriptional repressor